MYRTICCIYVYTSAAAVASFQRTLGKCSTPALRLSHHTQAPQGAALPPMLRLATSTTHQAFQACKRAAPSMMLLVMLGCSLHAAGRRVAQVSAPLRAAQLSGVQDQAFVLTGPGRELAEISRAIRAALPSCMRCLPAFACPLTRLYTPEVLSLAGTFSSQWRTAVEDVHHIPGRVRPGQPHASCGDADMSAPRRLESARARDGRVPSATE